MRTIVERKWPVLAVVLVAGLALAFTLHSNAPSLGAAASGPAVYRTAQVRGSSTGGDTTVEFRVGGFTPGTTAYLALVGWSFEPTGGDHVKDKVGIWTQKAVSGGWQWSNDFPVEANDEVRGQFYVFCNSVEGDDPYNILVNFLVIGQ
jgi:hypothetical protein